MEFSTNTKREIKNTSVSMLVSLFLILLTIFIILSTGTSYDPNKQKAVKNSFEDTFGKSNKKTVIFGRLAYLKLEDYALEIEKVIKKYGIVVINNDEDKLRITIPLNAIYFGDEPNFRSNTLDDMMQLMGILRNWANTESIYISVILSETNIQQDEERLSFFRKNIQGKRPLIGLKTKNDNNLDIIIERAV